MGYNIFTDHQRGDTRKIKILERKHVLENQLVNACLYVLVVFFIANIFSMGMFLSSIHWHLLLAIVVSVLYSIFISFAVMILYAISFLDNVSEERIKAAGGNRR